MRVLLGAICAFVGAGHARDKYIPFALITSDLAGVFCQPSRMASSSISAPRSGVYRRVAGMAHS